MDRSLSQHEFNKKDLAIISLNDGSDMNYSTAFIVVDIFEFGKVYFYL